MQTYGTSAIPDSVITVREQTTTAVSLAFDNSVGIVGGYDAANGTLDASNENTNIEISGVDEARDLFGEGSELHTQVRLAYLNNAGRIVCTPVGESTTTESFTSTQSISLTEDVIDPRFNPEEDVTVTETVSGDSVTVNYVDGTPSTPSESRTLNLNPQTKEGEFDQSGDYDVEYTAGDYTEATSTAAKADVRFPALCSANESINLNLHTGVDEQAKIMDFKRAVGNVPTATEPSSYAVPVDDQRLVLTAPSYGTAFDQKAFLSVAVAAQMASEELGSGATSAQIRGFDSVETDYSIDEITDFGDGDEVDRVTVVWEGLNGLKIIEDLTTSTGAKFRDVYRCEIIDDITYSVNAAADDFIQSTSPNTPDSRETGLEGPVRRVLRGAANNTPPLLASTDGSQPYAVSSSAGDNDEEANLTLGLDVVGLTKTVNVNIGVGAIESFQGAE